MAWSVVSASVKRSVGRRTRRAEDMVNCSNVLIQHKPAGRDPAGAGRSRVFALPHQGPCTIGRLGLTRMG